MNLNAWMAAEELIVPVLADFHSFHGMKLLFETVNALEEDLGHVLDHVVIVVNSFNATFKLAKEALDTGKGVYEIVMARGLLTREQLDRALDPETMTGPITAKA